MRLLPLAFRWRDIVLYIINGICCYSSGRIRERNIFCRASYILSGTYMMLRGLDFLTDGIDA